MFLALLVFVPAFIAGLGLTYLSDLDLRLEERLAVAVPLGALVVGCTGWVVAVAIGFDVASLTVSLLLAIAVSLAGWSRSGGQAAIVAEVRDLWRRVRLPIRSPESLLPLVLLLAVAWPLTVRILALAWVTMPDGGLAAGHLSTWSDGSAHLAYAGRFVVGGEVPIASPLAAGEPARSHLLADFFGAQVNVLGVSLPSALAVTSGYLALAVPAVLYLCGVRLTGSRAVALVGTLLFLGGGGLGFHLLADGIADGGWSVLLHLPREYGRDPDTSLWMDIPTLSYLYAQRNGLLGLPLGLVVLTVVWSTRTGAEGGGERGGDDHRVGKAGLLPAGVLLGLLPIAHGHAFLIVSAVVGVWAVAYDRRRPWWRFFGPSVALGVPVAWWLQPPDSAVRVMVGWMADGGIAGWLWFWLYNLGPFVPLLLVATWWRGTLKTDFARWFLPMWLLWIVPNLVAFHPSEWNNTKYFAFWQMVGAFLVAGLLVRIAKTGLPGRFAAALLFVVMTLSGALDLYRATDSEVTLIPWTTAEGLAVATWVRDNVPADAVVATAPTNTNPVTSLSGHRVLSGYPGWTYDIGVADWWQRVDDTRNILQGGDPALEALERRGVGYVVVGPLERSPDLGVDEAWWAANGRPVFVAGDWTVYAAPG